MTAFALVMSLLVPGLGPRLGRCGAVEAAPPARVADPLAIDRAVAQFEPFARKWVSIISRNLRHTASDMQIVADGDGTVVARFLEVDHNSLELQVKPSASGGTVCPFVGVLRYREHHYEARAGTADEVRNSQFHKVKTQRVTEIFRYVSGRWRD